jgi:hypothetical protein
MPKLNKSLLETSYPLLMTIITTETAANTKPVKNIAGRGFFFYALNFSLIKSTS